MLYWNKIEKRLSTARYSKQERYLTYVVLELCAIRVFMLRVRKQERYLTYVVLEPHLHVFWCLRARKTREISDICCTRTGIQERKLHYRWEIRETSDICCTGTLLVPAKRGLRTETRETFDECCTRTMGNLERRIYKASYVFRRLINPLIDLPSTGMHAHIFAS